MLFFCVHLVTHDLYGSWLFLSVEFPFKNIVSLFHGNLYIVVNVTSTCRLLQFVGNFGCAFCLLIIEWFCSLCHVRVAYLSVLPFVFLGIILQGMKHFVHHGQFIIRQRLFDYQNAWIPVTHKHTCIHSKALYGCFYVFQIIWHVNVNMHMLEMFFLTRDVYNSNAHVEPKR